MHQRKKGRVAPSTSTSLVLRAVPPGGRGIREAQPRFALPHWRREIRVVPRPVGRSQKVLNHNGEGSPSERRVLWLLKARATWFFLVVRWSVYTALTPRGGNFLSIPLRPSPRRGRFRQRSRYFRCRPPAVTPADPAGVSATFYIAARAAGLADPGRRVDLIERSVRRREGAPDSPKPSGGTPGASGSDGRPVTIQCDCVS